MKKILHKMRSTLLMLLLFGFSAVASSQVVTLDIRNVTLNEALKQLKNQTGVRLFYDVEKTGQVDCGEFQIDVDILFDSTLLFDSGTPVYIAAGRENILELGG